MSFLGHDWEGTIFVSGWFEGGGEPIRVTEPATGEQLATIGSASPADVARAAELATAAQESWQAVPPTERAAILRRAGALWEEHAEEIHGWIIRETGAIPPKAALETA